MNKNHRIILVLALFVSMPLLAESKDRHDEISIQREEVLGILEQKQAFVATRKKLKTKALLSSIPTRYFLEDTHSFISGSTHRKTLVLEDGSTWRVENSDVKKILNWKSGLPRENLTLEDLHNRELVINNKKKKKPDILFITQNGSWLSNYPIKIINYTRNESIEVGLIPGGEPIKDGKYTNTLMGLDRDESIIYLQGLENNTVWDLCEADYMTYRNWAIEDRIIIGINSGYRTSYTHILFNADTQSWVRVKPHI